MRSMFTKKQAALALACTLALGVLSAAASAQVVNFNEKALVTNTRGGPIMSGSGTRIKLLESVACGVPTVATSLAAEGLDLAACGPALTIADGWDAFAAAIERVAGLDRASPSDLFVSMYDWRCIVERIEL